MKKYVLRRLLVSGLTLFVITLVLFLLLQLMPGSPFNEDVYKRQDLHLKNKTDKPHDLCHRLKKLYLKRLKLT